MRGKISIQKDNSLVLSKKCLSLTVGECKNTCLSLKVYGFSMYDIWVDVSDSVDCVIELLVVRDFRFEFWSGSTVEESVF